jgi:predicted house-cleaning NTP pyrophosphatase (Maf/HAM1 superfamily)
LEYFTIIHLPVPLILASSSPFRKAILEKLGVVFVTASPDVDEARHDGETPYNLVLRLAAAKAKKSCQITLRSNYRL